MGGFCILPAVELVYEVRVAGFDAVANYVLSELKESLVVCADCG